MVRFIPILFFVILSSGICHGQSTDQRYPVIPKPGSVQVAEGYFQLSPDLKFITPEKQFRTVSDSLIKQISGLTHYPLKYCKADSKHSICISLDASIPKEGYTLLISPSKINISCSDAAGAFYAVQSLKQLIQPLYVLENRKGKPSFIIPCCKIQDSPAYEWRGFHLDVSRHFFTKEYILRIIDWISAYKLNKLHLHLTDDQGWRVQSEKFPQLTETGAWRTFNEQDSACMEKVGNNPDFIIDKRFIREDGTYGGFYSKKDLEEIIRYAASRYVEIIPEIDMPGHMSAAIRAFPFLSCTGSTGWGKEFSYPICPCKEETMQFSMSVWDEIADLFPSPYVHIGCDEVEKDSWESSESCRQFMQDHAFSDSKEVQNYFVKQLQQHLESKGMKVIAWDDVIEGKVDSNLILMYWRDWLKDSPLRCAKNGNNLILTPWSPFYISSHHSDTSFRELYEYDPVLHFSTEIMNKVIGLQSCVWTEEIPSEDRFEYLVFPRLQALSEVCWSQGRDWIGFRQRLDVRMKDMDAGNINYRRPSTE